MYKYIYLIYALERKTQQNCVTDQMGIWTLHIHAGF